MNLRERFHEVMNFNAGVPSMKWEFGLWGETVDNWYRDGLPQKHYPELFAPDDPNRTPTSHLYATAWNSLGKMPKGIAIMAGGLYWPTQGFPLDVDVKAYFGMDYTQTLVNVNLLFEPLFEIKILKETAEHFDYIDMDGVQRRFLKEFGTIPTGMRYPLKDRKSWEQLKAERVDLKDVSKRFPPNWDKLVQEYKNRDYPLALGGYPHGFFGTLAHLMGYETLF